QNKWHISDIDEQIENNNSLLKIYKENLLEIESNIAEEKEKIRGIKKNIGRNGDLLVMTKEFRENELLVDIIGKLYTPFLAEKEKIYSLFPKGSVERNNIDRQVKRYQNEIKKEKKKILKGLIVDQKALEAKKIVIDKSIQELTERVAYLADKQIEYDDLTRDLAQLRNADEVYLTRLEEARIKEQKDQLGVANVSVISRAYKPSRPAYPRKKLMLVVSVAAGFIAGIGSGLAAYYLDHTVKEPNDLLRLTKVPVLASLENIKHSS
ncbi:MAG: hypothetical protein D3910_21140, partial [Candidatus Electrothrix sp. ATG2]|nr:hypothetical protein [Candidatus Electrothrix sp. ATG2]